MKRKNLPRVFAVTAVCLLLSSSLASFALSQEVKLGRVNLPDVVKHSARVKAVQAELKQMQLDAEAKIKPLKQELVGIQGRLKNEQSKLKPEEKAKLEAELKTKEEAIGSEQDALRAKLAFRQKSLQNTVFTQLKDAISNVAKREGLGVVFQSEALAYAEAIPDISEKVAKELDSMPATEGKKE